jgi:uncharacterized protein
VPTQRDIEVVQRLYAAFAAGDSATVATCFHPDAVWRLPGHGALSGSYHGWAAIRDELFAWQGPLSGGTFRARLLDLAVGEIYIVAVVRATAMHQGRTLDQTVCQCMRVDDGLIREVRGHYSDEAALDDFWQDPSRFYPA